LSPTPRISDGLDLVTITHANPDLTASEIVTVAESWGCAHPLALAVEATSTWFGNEWAPADLVARCRTRHVTITDRLLMSSFAGPLSNSHFRSLCAVAGLRGRSDRHRALRGLVSRGHRERE
jgi:hypothetical protein